MNAPADNALLATPALPTQFGGDRAPRRDAVEVCVLRSRFPHATITECHTAAARALPGVAAVLTAADIPGERVLGGPWHGLAVLADGRVDYHGQAVSLVATRPEANANRAADAVAVSYQPLPPIIDLDEAIAVEAYLGDEEPLAVGDIESARANAPHSLAGTLEIPGDSSPWPEPEWAHAEPDGNGGLRVTSPVADLPALHHELARVLDLPMSALHLERSPARACGGNDPLPTIHAALVARATGRAVRLIHSGPTSDAPAARIDFDAGYDDHGSLLAVDLRMRVDAGAGALHPSAMVADFLRHLDGVYHLPAARLSVRLCRSHNPPRHARTGRFAAMAQLGIEEVIGRIARALGVLPEILRQRNLPPAGTSHTAAGVPIAAADLTALWKRALHDSDFADRRKRIDTANTRNPITRNGLAAVPVKLAPADGRRDATSSRATLEVFPDGGIRVACEAVGNAQRAAIVRAVVEETGARARSVRVVTDSGQASHRDTSPQLPVDAVRDAARAWHAAVLPLMLRIFHENGATGVTADHLALGDGRICDRRDPDVGYPFESLVTYAHAQSADMRSQGTAGDPRIGDPPQSCLCGIAVAEVEVEAFTGTARAIRTDVYQQLDAAWIAPATASRRLAGSFARGLAWLSGSTAAPTLDDFPAAFHLTIAPVEDRPGDALALASREALRDAIAAFAADPRHATVDLPAAPNAEAVFRLIQHQRARR